MKKLLLGTFTVFSLFSFSSVAQDKFADVTGMEQKLEMTNQELMQVETRLGALEARLKELKLDNSRDTVPVENEISILNQKKNALLDVKYSTEAYLSTFKESAAKPVIVKKQILKEDFDKMPERSQKEILAHPERYEIITE